MTGRPREVARRRDRFLIAIGAVEDIASDVPTLLTGPWANAQWKASDLFEMLAVRAYTEWEDFAHELIVLWLAADTTALAKETSLNIPRQVSFDLAEALLTSRGYLEFPDMAQLRGKARRWLVDSPFERLTTAERTTIDDLRTLRNAIVHRSRQSEQSYAKRFSTTVRPAVLLSQGSPPKLDGYLESLTAAANLLV